MSKTTLAPLNSALPFARNFDVALRQAQELRKRGELDQASRVLAQLILASPDDPRVVGEYGKVMLESGRTGDAVAFLERAVVLQPSDWTLSSALGVAYDQSGKREAARTAFHRALTIKPGESSVLSNLAVSHMQAGELDEAERLLLQASEQGKDVPGIAAKLATVRNMRTTSAQSRPVAVSALPQPIGPVPDLGSPAHAVEIAPAETPQPSLTTPVEIASPGPAVVLFPQEPAEEEEDPAVLEDEAETVAILPPPAPAVVAVVRERPTKPQSIKSLPSTVKAPTQQVAHATPAPRAAKAPAKTSPVTVQPSHRISVSAQVKPTQPEAAAAATSSVTLAAPVVAVAPTTALPSANASPQSAIMTRRAGVTPAVSRTAPVPLVLAPRDSWESMVRVSLPQATAAVPGAGKQQTEKADSASAAEPATGWSGILTRWVFAAFGYVTSLWA